MKALNENSFFQVNGGFAPLFQVGAPVAARAATAGLGTFNNGSAAVLLAASQMQNLNNLGAKMGEAAFNATHPNPLGQMVYNK